MANTPRILVCDDERDVADLVAHLLSREGFDLRACYGGQEALDALNAESFDLVILDIMMPGIDGFEVCRRIRGKGDVPSVVFLTAKSEEFDKVLGFTLGADDYVTKPFKPREFVARIKARLRRRESGAPSGDALSARGIELDLSAHTATLHGTELPLTPREFDCLACLLRAQGSPVSARDMFERVWGVEYAASSHNAVMVYMRHLRKKLADVDSSEEFIETVWGVGYRIGRGKQD